MPRVLLVEDELSAARMLKTILEMEGFTVTLAANGKRALELLVDVQPELIITDYMMPVMNGIEMAQAVRVIPSFVKVPILMTSGSPNSRLELRRQHFRRFCASPFKSTSYLLPLGGSSHAQTYDGQQHR
jgi:CheY-like chemotaxis protein